MNAPLRRTPPAAAIVAAVLGLLTGLVPAVFGFLLLLFASGIGTVEALSLALMATLVAALVTGAVLLLTGRSWLALALPAGLVGGYVVVGTTSGALGGGPYGFGTLTALVPVATVVLCLLPGVRGWVAERRRARSQRSVRTSP